MSMGKAAKQARNRAIKRKQREERTKARVEYAKAMIEFINQNPNAVCESDRLGIVPNHLVKHACGKFIKENEI